MRRAALTPGEVLWVTIALLLALAPHAARFSFVLVLGFGLACLWRYLGARDRLPLPDAEHRLLWLVKQAVAVAAFVSIYIAYRGKLGRDAGVELLAALLGLKLLEMRTERDYYVVTFLCYFLVVTNFFYSQTIPTAVYMLGVVIAVTATLVQFNTPPARRDARAMLRQAAALTAQSLPLMALAFLLFPRIGSPLWGLPADAFDATSGLSDSMQVGDITRLGLSSDIAFRVQFHGAEPRARDRYWRGPVLWRTDGRTWTGAPFAPEPAPPVEPLGERYKYSVTLEPHRKRWLLGLDVVTTLGTGARQTVDYATLSSQPVRKRLRYELESATLYRTAPPSATQRRAALQLPADRHPRARALAAQWRASARDDQGVIDLALRYYREQRFYYSLTPPPLPRDPVDQFLFDTREGFCEHFASSFVVLMRAAGIPARVVTGYQGGELNEVGQYLVLRQRDAHAWAEVVLPERGWVRVDPTAAVAPERVSLGFSDALPAGAEAPVFDRRGFTGQFWTRMRDALDAVTYGWNQWVLGYTPAQQQYLLDLLGAGDWRTGELVMALSVSLGLGLLVLAVLLWRAQRAVTDPAAAAYARFCARLAAVDLARAPHEAPLAYCARVARARADLAAEVTAITKLYTQLRYGRGRLGVRALEARVRRFRPARAR